MISKILKSGGRRINSLLRFTEPRRNSEIYGLTQQTRRAAVSIEANLAEGCGRKTDGELIRFASIANGSAYELECELLIARDLGYLSGTAHDSLDRATKCVSSMISGLVGAIRRHSKLRAL